MDSDDNQIPMNMVQQVLPGQANQAISGAQVAKEQQPMRRSPRTRGQEARPLQQASSRPGHLASPNKRDSGDPNDETYHVESGEEQDEDSSELEEDEQYTSRSPTRVRDTSLDGPLTKIPKRAGDVSMPLIPAKYVVDTWKKAWGLCFDDSVFTDAQFSELIDCLPGVAPSTIAVQNTKQLGQKDEYNIAPFLTALGKLKQEELAQLSKDVGKLITSLSFEFLEAIEDEEVLPHQEEKKEEPVLPDGVSKLEVDPLLFDSILKYNTQRHCIPFHANVTNEILNYVRSAQFSCSKRLFDIVTADPPWNITNERRVHRGVNLKYKVMKDEEIEKLRFGRLQTEGFLFLWVVNCKLQLGLKMLKMNGYHFVDSIDWIKQHSSGMLAKGNGYYLQHAREICLVGLKGKKKFKQIKAKFKLTRDVIISERRAASQKPDEIYDIAESMIPNGYYLEIFGRRNNLRNGWVTIGNEL